MMNRLFLLSAGVVVLGALVLENICGGAWYTMTDLGNCIPNDINASGQIVGRSTSYYPRALLYDHGRMTDLGVLPGSSSSLASGINTSGQVVGTNDYYSIFLYSDSTMTDLGRFPNSGRNEVAGINDSGQIAGTANVSGYSRAFLRGSDGTMTDLGLSGAAAAGINANAEVAGSYQTTGGKRAFRYHDGETTNLGTLPGGNYSEATAINDQGVVVGVAAGGPTIGRDHAFVYDNGIMMDLGAFAYHSRACDINNKNQIVGESMTSDGSSHAFLYEYGGYPSMIDLNDAIAPATGWTLCSAKAVNDSGWIIGQGYTASGRGGGFLLTPALGAGLSLSLGFPELRMAQGSTVDPGQSTVTVFSQGTAQQFAISSSELVLSRASGTVEKNAQMSSPFSFRWADTSTTGPQTGTISLENLSDASDPNNHEMVVSGTVLANRQLTVDPIGSTAEPVRTIVKNTVGTHIRTGSDPVLDDDDHATRVILVNGKIWDSTHQVQAISWWGGACFGEPNLEAPLMAVFSKPGRHDGAINVATKFVKDYEDPSVGAVVQPAVLEYHAVAVEQRILKATTKQIDFGDVLRGADVSGNFIVDSQNQYPDADHATMVNVMQSGLGELTTDETYIDAGGSVPVPMSGRLSFYNANLNVQGKLSVFSAEDPAVGDSMPYKGLQVSYKANVGVAKRITTAPTGTMDFSDPKATTLSAFVASGSKMTHLSSKVKEQKTLAAPNNWGLASPLPPKKLYGIVGSEAEIVDSTADDSDTTVTMQWRKRMRGEANHPQTGVSSTLPGGGWLTSDVVEIGGVDIGVTFALQMSFDNRIDKTFDGLMDGQLENKFPDLYLAEFDDHVGRWENAALLCPPGADAQLGVLWSLADFLTESRNHGYTLENVKGSWGVDPMPNVAGQYYAWAITTGGGSGVFAVRSELSKTMGAMQSVAVPEPAAMLLLLLAAAGLATYRLLCLKFRPDQRCDWDDDLHTQKSFHTNSNSNLRFTACLPFGKTGCFS